MDGASTFKREIPKGKSKNQQSILWPEEVAKNGCKMTKNDMERKNKFISLQTGYFIFFGWSKSLGKNP